MADVHGGYYTLWSPQSVGTSICKHATEPQCHCNSIRCGRLRCLWTSPWKLYRDCLCEWKRICRSQRKCSAESKRAAFCYCHNNAHCDTDFYTDPESNTQSDTQSNIILDAYDDQVRNSISNYIADPFKDAISNHLADRYREPNGLPESHADPNPYWDPVKDAHFITES